MIDIAAIRTELDQLENLRGEEKLVAARMAYAHVSEAERYAAFHPEVPYETVREIKSFIPIASAHINRLEAGQRRSEALRVKRIEARR